MKSMTGYAIVEDTTENYKLSVELKSYNNKFLEISVNIPKFLNRLEAVFKNVIKESIQRGSIELNIQYQDLNNEIKLEFDEKLFDEYLTIYQKMLNKLKNPQNISLSNFLPINGIINNNKEFDYDFLENLIVTKIKEAISKFCETREKEGYQTYLDIKKNVELIKEKVSSISTFEKVIDERIKIDVKKKLSEVLGSKIDEDRYLQEVAVLLLKYNINEELSRLNTHLSVLEKMIEEKEPIGKKVDFLCQEINREINTTASKSFIPEINLAVVDIKNFLENIREQIRNVE